MRRKIFALSLVAMMATSLTACTAGTNGSTSSDSKTSETAAAETDDGQTHATSDTVTLKNGEYSDFDLEDSYDEKKATKITLSGDTVETDGSGVSADGTTITISAKGTYLLSGSLNDGQVIVDVADKSDVQLVLGNVSITCSDSAAIYVKQAGNVVITLAEDTENSVTDGTEYILEDENSDEPNAAIFSKDDLTFNGTGSLTVTGNYNNGIQSKDDLKFISGTYTITSADDGIVGKDSVSFQDGTYTITAQGDGIKATNVKESDKGYVMINGGTYTVTSENDGIQAETLLRVNDGTFQITTGGGSANAEVKTSDPRGNMRGGAGMDGAKQGDRGNMQGGEDMDGTEQGDKGKPQRAPENGTSEPAPNQDATSEAPPNGDATSEPTPNEDASGDTTTESCKGLKSYVDMIVEGGSLEIDSADDTLHSNGNITLDGGSYQLSAGDDGVHADKALTIGDVSLTLATSYEGLEGCDITIDGGDIKVTASDDGVNAVNGDDGDSVTTAEAEKQRGGGMNADDGSLLTINGGNLYIEASGDGLDSNGKIVMTGGTVEVQGPSNGGNGTLDYGGGFTLSGGKFIGLGSSQMAQTPDESSTQGYIATSGLSIEKGTTIAVKDDSGTTIATTTSTLAADWVCFSNEQIKSGETYTLAVGDSSQEVTAK